MLVRLRGGGDRRGFGAMTLSLGIPQRKTVYVPTTDIYGGLGGGAKEGSVALSTGGAAPSSRTPTPAPTMSREDEIRLLSQSLGLGNTQKTSGITATGQRITYSKPGIYAEPTTTPSPPEAPPASSPPPANVIPGPWPGSSDGHPMPTAAESGRGFAPRDLLFAGAIALGVYLLARETKKP